MAPRTPPARRVVAVVGGGASGTLAAIQLLNAARTALEVVLIEREERAGAGVAYGTRDDAHLLNVPASRMSALPERPDDFLEWLGDRSPFPNAFVPRRLYGEYLAASLGQSEREAAPTATLRRVRGLVVAIETPGGDTGARLVLDGGGSIPVSGVVIATGNRPPVTPVVPGLASLGPERYAPNPWAEGAIQTLRTVGPVLMLGSGLTMVDVVLTLSRQPSSNVFVAISRRGLLPHAHAAPQPPIRPASTAPQSILSLVRSVRSAIECRHGVSGGDWRAIVDGLRPVTPVFWASLSDGDKRRFLRHVRPYWDAARHRMAPEAAEQVAALRRAGTLTVRAARLVGVTDDGRGIRAVIRGRGHDRHDVVDVAAIVNCMGPAELDGESNEPVVDGLLRAGHARRGPAGLGLDTAENGALLSAAGRPSRMLFALGPMRRGNLWETSAIPEIRAQAHALAATILHRAAEATALEHRS